MEGLGIRLVQSDMHEQEHHCSHISWSPSSLAFLSASSLFSLSRSSLVSLGGCMHQKEMMPFCIYSSAC